MSLLSTLSPEQIALLKAELATMETGTDGRSPFRPRQLHDLRHLPSATDPRPLFVWSAESPRDMPVGPPKFYPKLMWHGVTGKEITVHSAAEERQMADVYVPLPPNTAPLDPVTRAAQEFAQLSPEDQAFVIEMQRKAKLERMNAIMNELTDGQIDQVTGIVKPKRKASA